MIPAFFSAFWQWGDFCLPCPDKNSSTSVRREPNIGVRRSRTTLGDRCISMPTMFSVPGGTPVGGDCQGISLGWLSGNSFSTERVPLGVWGTECPHITGGPGAARPRERGRRRRPKSVFPKNYQFPPARVSLCKEVKRPARQRTIDPPISTMRWETSGFM